MIIYVVTSGEYSAYDIDALYTSREAAEEHVKRGNLSRSNSYESDYYRVEEYETDAVVPQLYYSVSYFRRFTENHQRTGEPVLVEGSPTLSHGLPQTHVVRNGNVYEGIAWGQSIETAKKNLWDAIAKAKAEHEGI